MHTRLSVIRIDAYLLTLLLLASLLTLPLAGLFHSTMVWRMPTGELASPQQNPTVNLRPTAYHFQYHNGTIKGVNPAQRFDITIGHGGLFVQDISGRWDWQLSLAQWGYAGHLQPSGTAVIATQDILSAESYEWFYGQTLSEWVRNRPQGLEHGFTIFERPPGDAGERELVLQMQYRGSYQPQVLAGGQGVRFIDRNGQVQLNYDRLVVFDATGRILPALIQVSTPTSIGESSLEFRIDDRGAVYPVTVDPYLTTFSAQLLADDGGADDQLGRSVAVSGDIAVVGAPGDSPNDPSADPNVYNDAAYIFYRNQGGLPDSWGQVKKLSPPPDTNSNQTFGHSVAVAGEIVAVGAPTYADDGNINRGAVYIFGRNQGGINNWGLVTQITAPDAANGDKFGWDVAFDGQHLVVGAPNYEDSVISNAGAVYVFQRNQGGADNWGFVTMLSHPDPEINDRFGYSVDVHGDQIVGGSPYREGTAGVFQGAVFLFVVDPAASQGWSPGVEILAGDPAAYDYFGWDVAVYHEHLLVGAPLKNSQRGAAYVFERNLGGMDNWGQARKLLPLESTGSAQFGIAVDLSHDSVVVGAYTWQESVAAPGRGAAYIYERNQGGPDAWGQVTELHEPSGLANIFFGRSVALQESALVIGANGFDVGSETDQGAAFAYYRSGSSWELVAEPTADVPNNGDSFGCSLASTTEYLAVGACNFSSDQGKVYIYYRNQGGAENWGLWTTLTASDGTAGDLFGASLAIGEDKLLVGAPGADSDQGAVYVFYRNKNGADAWGQQAILRDIAGSAGDQFGAAVDLDLDLAAIGAPGVSGDAGAVYVFKRVVDTTLDQERWVQVQKKTQSGSGALGRSVAINSSQVLAGAPATNSNQGQAYLYYRNEGGADSWGLKRTLPSTAPAAGDEYGTAVDLHSGRAAVGAPGASSQRGAVYLYAINQGGADQWGLLDSITGGQSGDRRGEQLDLEGDMLAVGAPQADSVFTYKRNQGGADAWGLFGTLSGQSAGQMYGAGVSLLEDVLSVGAPAANQSAGKAYVYLLTEFFQDLSISKTANVSRIGPGDSMVFAIDFENLGDREATGVVITDTLPPGLIDWTSSFTGISLQQPAEGVWTAAAIPPAAGGTITLTGTVAADAVSGIYTNTVEIQANEPEIYYNNNLANLSFEIDTTPPAQPVRTSPADNTVFTATNDITMEWRASTSPDVAGYYLDFNGTIINTTEQRVTVNNLIDGVYNWRVAAYDDLGNTSSYTSWWSFTVDTGLQENQPPVAVAGADQRVLPGTLVTIDGSNSFDPDGQTPLSYQWTQVAGPAISFPDDAASFSFTAPDTPTSLAFELVVRDVLGLASAPDRVTVVVNSSGLFEIYLPLILEAE